MNWLDNKDRVGSLLLLVFSITYLRYAFDLPLDTTAGDESFSAKTLPIGLAVAAIGFSLLELIFSVRRSTDNRISESVQGFNWVSTTLLISAMLVYSMVFDLLGFMFSSYLFLHVSFIILGERRVLFSAAVAASLVVLLWLILTRAFGIFLDSGDLFRFLVDLVK